MVLLPLLHDCLLPVDQFIFSVYVECDALPCLERAALGCVLQAWVGAIVDVETICRVEIKPAVEVGPHHRPVRVASLLQDSELAVRTLFGPVCRCRVTHWSSR